MSQENVEIVRRSVEAFGGDDEEAFLQTLDPDLVWYPIEDGHTPARGIEGARGIRQRWLDTWEGHSIAVEDLDHRYHGWVALLPGQRTARCMFVAIRASS